MPRINTSNCVSCLFWFGTDAIGILPILIGMKEAKEVPIAIGIAVIPIAIGTGWGGETHEFKRANEFEIQTISIFLKNFY